MRDFDEIPGLYQKLRLLISTGAYEDWDALGAEFEVSGSTVQAWGHGSAKQRPNWVPERHQEKLIEVFAKCFSTTHGVSRIRSLILGPVRDIEAEFSLRDFLSLPQLIERDGKSDSCKLLLKPSSRGLVETDEAPTPAARFAVDLGSSFRLEFATRFHGQHIYALQHVARTWSPLVSGFDAKAATIHLPGFGRAGTPIHMSEKEQAGRHRFVVLQTRESVPLSARNALLHDSVLDIRAIDDLSAFYSRQKPTERRIFYADVRIGTRGEQNDES